MEIFLVAFFSFVSILLFIIGMAMAEDNISGFIIGVFFLTSTLCTIEFVCRISNKDERKLTPIEVYRGNTTLEITYRDSIAVDSVVVWKNKEE